MGLRAESMCQYVVWKDIMYMRNRRKYKIMKLYCKEDETLVFLTKIFK